VADTEPIPQFVVPPPSAICSLLPRPLILTGFFRDILTRHFISPQYIEMPDLRHLIWREDLQTGILIESRWRWRPQLTQKRPAILISRNAYQNQRMGLQDRHQPTRGDGGEGHFATAWIGSHTFFCIGGSGAQAELLASEVQRELTEFGSLIERGMSLLRFQVLEVGAIGELEEATENYVVPVNVGYAFQELWVLRQQAPTLKRISLSMILDM
jgi:hypothetical protein